MRLPVQFLLSSTSTHQVAKPLPIDWDIPTSACLLPINGTGGHVGYFDVEATPLRNFIYPALFDDEVYPHGYSASIVWLLAKGSDHLPPTPDHPVEILGDPWTTYELDLIHGREERVMNVMPPTNFDVFWDSVWGPSDGKHAIFVWDFNASCKYLGLGALVYYWTIPSTLPVGEAYRFQLSTNDSNTRYLSGEFRIGTDHGRRGWGVGTGELELGRVILSLLARLWGRR